MDRINDESIWLRSPARADVFVGREPRECLQAPSEVVGVNEVLQVLPKLVVTLVVEALDGGLFDRSVHTFDLSIGPRMVWFCRAVLDALGRTRAVEHVHAQSGGRAVSARRQVAELNPVVGQNRVNLVGHDAENVVQERGGSLDSGLFFEPREGELGGTVDSNEHVQLALGCTHLGNVDMEVANRVALECLARWPVALNMRQSADPMTLQTSVQ